MTQEERQTELNAILEVLRSASERANRIAESTQNPSQETLDNLAEQIADARRRLYWVLQG